MAETSTTEYGDQLRLLLCFVWVSLLLSVGLSVGRSVWASQNEGFRPTPSAFPLPLSLCLAGFLPLSLSPITHVHPFH